MLPFINLKFSELHFKVYLLSFSLPFILFILQFAKIEKIIQYHINSSNIFLFPDEKSQQKVVDFFVQSRKRKRVRNRHFRSIFLLFDNGNCHMWHLRFSDIANDTITYGS